MRYAADWYQLNHSVFCTQTFIPRILTGVSCMMTQSSYHRTISVALASMLVFALVLIAPFASEFLGTGSQIKAQITCPAGYTLVTATYYYPNGGDCCEIKVTFCQKTDFGSGMIFVEIKEVVLKDSTCWLSIDAPGIFSYVRKKVIDQAYGPSIPPCPNSTPVAIQTSFASCQKWVPVQVGNHVELRFVACQGSATCTLICNVCKGETEDPCMDGTYMIEYVNCTWISQGQCEPGLPTECKVVCGS